MATVLENPVAAPLEADEFMLSDGGSAVLHGISWKMYRRLRKMPENCNIRMTYDRGELEIMSPSSTHEVIARLLGTLIDVWAEELDIEIVPCRMLTIRRPDLDRGLEPDDCVYVQHELEMRDKKKVDFKVDPPPDLAIEVQVSKRFLDKRRLYSAFGVPEVWWWRGKSLKVHELNGSEYVPRETSLCFPNFPIAKAEEKIRRIGTEGQTTLLLRFRDWVRANAQPAV